jgi:hypothetical protein
MLWRRLQAGASKVVISSVLNAVVPARVDLLIALNCCCSRQSLKVVTSL